MKQGITKVYFLSVLCLLALALADNAQAGNTFCWKGYSQNDQNQNLASCNQQKQPGQTCSDNWSQTGAGVYDVCLQNPDHVLKPVFCLKGFNQNDQDANLTTCRSQVSAGQSCETNAWVHQHGVYDVCIMQ